MNVETGNGDAAGSEQRESEMEKKKMKRRANDACN